MQGADEALQNFHGSRHRGYQVWNEANISTFWTGTPRRMAAADQGHARRAQPGRPARQGRRRRRMVTRLQFQLDGDRSYYHQRVGGKPVWRYYDAVALSLYPLAEVRRPHRRPRGHDQAAQRRQEELRRAGVPASKPIWDTEINYGLQSGTKGGTAAAPISGARQAANVMRTYLLQRGERRQAGRSGTATTGAGSPAAAPSATPCSPTPTTPRTVTAAGRAYVLVQQWMHGTLLGTPGSPAVRARTGTAPTRAWSRTPRAQRTSTGTRSARAKVRLPKGVHATSRACSGQRPTVKPAVDAEGRLQAGDGLPLTDRRVTPRSGARRSWSPGRGHPVEAGVLRSSPARRPGRGVRA